MISCHGMIFIQNMFNLVWKRSYFSWKLGMKKVWFSVKMVRFQLWQACMLVIKLGGTFFDFSPLFYTQTILLPVVIQYIHTLATIVFLPFRVKIILFSYQVFSLNNTFFILNWRYFERKSYHDKKSSHFSSRPKIRDILPLI